MLGESCGAASGRTVGVEFVGGAECERVTQRQHIAAKQRLEQREPAAQQSDRWRKLCHVVFVIVVIVIVASDAAAGSCIALLLLAYVDHVRNRESRFDWLDAALGVREAQRVEQLAISLQRAIADQQHRQPGQLWREPIEQVAFRRRIQQMVLKIFKLKPKKKLQITNYYLLFF